MVLLIMITLGVNITILTKKKLLKRYIYINIFICLLQSIMFFSNGFYFKYTQGFEWIGYFYTNNVTTDSGLRFTPPKILLELIFNFNDSDGIAVGINYIAFLLFGYYLFLLKSPTLFKD